MAIIDKIDKLSGTDTRSRNITQAIDKYSGKGPSKNIDDAVKKLDETGTLGKMGIKERIDHLSNAQTMSRDITQAIDRHTNKGPSKNIEEALKWWEDPTPPGPGITEAYAVFDLEDNSLVFFRDEPGKYTNGQDEGTKIYYTGIETEMELFGWIDRDERATTVLFNDIIKPISTKMWFSGCSELTSIDLDKLNTSNVTDMSSMFYDCESLTSLDLSGFDTSNVTNMRGMFSWCLGLTSIDVSGFDTSNITDMSKMFENCRNLTTDITINDISKYPADTFTNTATNPPAKITLYGEGSVTSADIDTFIAEVKAISPDSNIVNGMITEAYAVFDSVDNSLVFFRDEPGKYSDRQEIDTKTYYTGVETKTSAYGWSTKLHLTTNVRFDDVIKPIGTNRWFGSHSNLASITGLDKLDTSVVTDMSAMFEHCSTLTSLDLSSFDTSNVTYMAQMFTGCSSLATLNLSGFNTSNVTDMHSMFSSCEALTSIGTTALYTAANTVVDWMFSGCSNLTAGVIVSSFSNYEYANAFAYSATVSPAQITLYYNSPATSGNLNAIIADAKASDPNSNIVNGGPAQ